MPVVNSNNKRTVIKHLIENEGNQIDLDRMGDGRPPLANKSNLSRNFLVYPEHKTVKPRVNSLGATNSNLTPF